MAAPISLGAVIARAINRGNLENRVLVGGFISPSEIRDYANELYAELWDLLLAARAQEHMRKTQTITTVNGTSSYPLAADMEELISVDINISPVPAGGPNPQFLNAVPYMESERNMFRFYPGLVGWYWGIPVYYRIQGSTQLSGSTSVLKTINFVPTPQAAYPVQLNYYPTFTPFATDGTQDAFVFDGVNGWEGYVVWGIVALCKAKLKEDASAALGRMAQFKDRILELREMNDAGNAERVHDTMSENSGFPGMGSW